MEQRLTLITIGVDDVKRVRTFYEEVFGWEPTAQSNDTITFFHLNGIQLALFGRQALADDADVSSTGQGFRAFALAHNLRSVEEVDRLFEELRGKGTMIVKSPSKTDWGGYSGYISDPEGSLWEIAYNPFMKYDELGNVLAE